VSDALLELIRQHVEDDRAQFSRQNDVLDEIRTDVKSLLESRAHQRGAKGAILAIASGASVIVSGVFALIAWYFK
jgi:predicted component of type VI protein secretion system